MANGEWQNAIHYLLRNPLSELTIYYSLKRSFMEKESYAIGDRVEKLCTVCNEERGHVVASVTKRGLISRVTCPKCGTRSS
ncbi:MAG TPA: hypothetical protein VFH31_10935, partial [Pyrinomonadaceae bacterium]|nr:hypothetical protein [Pyrinomonadaceae bacterium]